MTRMKRYALVLVTGVAVGLLSAAAAFSQEPNGPPGGPPPRDGVGEQPGPGAPDGELDDHPMPPTGPGTPQGDDRPPHDGAPQGQRPGMQPAPNGPPPGGGPQGPGMQPPRVGPLPGGGPQGPKPGMQPSFNPPGAGPHGAGGPGGDPFSGPGLGRGMMPGQMSKADTEMFKLQRRDMELEQQSRQLAMQYQHASIEDRDKIKQEVVELVKKQFEVRQERHTLALKRLEDELKRLREIVDRRVKARQQIIDKRVSELIGPDDPGIEF
jgi:hypothetical protein